MAKSRMLRPEFWTDEKVVSLSPLARLLFLGMWNYACDNGHLDESILQLKMRVLPAESCDTAELLEEVIASGMVVRTNGCLKIVNLADKQPLDLRFLVFCEHCEHDEQARYKKEDKKPSRGSRASVTRATPVVPSSARRSGDGDGDGDGDGKRVRGRVRSPERPLGQDWQPNDRHHDYARKHNLDLDREAFRFRHHAAANDRRQRDWNAAFSSWLDKARDFSPQRQQSPWDRAIDVTGQGTPR